MGRCRAVRGAPKTLPRIARCIGVFTRNQPQLPDLNSLLLMLAAAQCKGAVLKRGAREGADEHGVPDDQVVAPGDEWIANA